MRAAIFNGPGKPITIERFDDPTPGADQVVVKVCRCGICGSDVSMTSDSLIAFPAGIGLGHEYAGEVAAVGPGVTNVKVGDHVACMTTVGCGTCDVCRTTGNVFYCTSPPVRNVTQGFAEYARVAAKGAIPLPKSAGFAAGALTEPMACCLHAVDAARMRGGERVLVLGAGAMAVGFIYWARARGARKIAVMSRSSHRNDVLMTMGADAICDFNTETAKLYELLGGPPDVVAECVGKEGMLKRAIDCVRPQGAVVSLGMCGHQEPIVTGVCSFKELSLLFPLGWTADEYVTTLREFDTGRLRTDVMVSDVVSLEAVPETIEKLRQGMKSLKIHVDPRMDAAHG